LPALGKNTAPYLVSWILPVLCKNSGAAESPESVKAVTLNLENCSCSQATCLHRHNKILKQKEASITNEIRHIFIYWLIDKKKISGWVQTRGFEILIFLCFKLTEKPTSLATSEKPCQKRTISNL
jgi:hypothetical protein